MRIDVKPMSMNAAYSGRRFKTKLYKTYETACMIRMRAMVMPEGNLGIELRIGVSNRGFDADNSLKPIIDIMQKKYHFNDNRVYKVCVTKEVVPKGEEFIEFDIYEVME